MKRDVYQVISDRIISLLDEGTVPWHRPWATAEGPPQNLVSRKPYRGVNPFLLNCAGFGSPFWLTFRQAKELGGHVKQGEHGFPIVFWRWLEFEDKDAPLDATNRTKRVPMARYYTAFNLAQCEGINPAKLPPQIEPQGHFEPLQECQRIIDNMAQRPPIKLGMSRAAYCPEADEVLMPNPESFDGPECFYSVLFHELAHSTGHRSRLNRPGIRQLASFGSNCYSKEELVGEMTAAFLCGHGGIANATVDNSASYIANWLARLKGDRKLVISAAAAAQKAADFILAVKHEDGGAE